MKEKNLGIVHIMTTYLFLPLILIASGIGLIHLAIALFTGLSLDFGILTVTDIAIFILETILAFYAFISLIQKNQKAVYLVSTFLVMFTADRLVTGINMLLMYDDYTLRLFLIAMIIPLTISVTLIKYYSNRIALLNSPRMGSRVRNIEDFVNGYLIIYGMCLLLFIWGYSAYHMFHESIGYGLFGIFVPIVAQIVYLVRTGFTTSYAYDCYCFIVILATYMTVAYMGAFYQQKREYIDYEMYKDFVNAKAQTDHTAKINREIVELDTSIRNMKKILEQAQKTYGNLTIHQINSMFENGEISDIEVRDLISHMKNARDIIDTYPTLIEESERRRDDLLSSIKNPNVNQ